MNQQDVLPRSLTFNTTHASSAEIWWKCRHGHEWVSTVDNRHHGNGCPYCSGNLILPEKSIAAKYPHLLEEWHPTKNGDLSPEEIGPHSMQRPWWICKAGHEWKAYVGNRTKGATCPHCAGKAFTSERCLAVRYPELVIEWHPGLNDDLTPFDVTYGCDRNVWWRCAQGHEWKAVIKDRSGKGIGCPYCSGKRATPEDNFAVRFPELAKEWHPTRNGDARPQHFRPFSGKKAWWLCSKINGHEWQARLYDRARPRGCPYCSGRRVGQDNNLLVLHPELSRQWHPVKNDGLSPGMFRPGSSKKVWWCCATGHEWQADIKSRVQGNGCLACSRIRRSRKK